MFCVCFVNNAGTQPGKISFMEEAEYIEANDKVTEMSSLTACTNKAIQDGYTENFKIVNNMLCTEEGKCFSPSDVHIVNYYRFEGESDPADSSILYVITAGTKVNGMLIDAYGAYADEAINKFIARVKDINKH